MGAHCRLGARLGHCKRGAGASPTPAPVSASSTNSEPSSYPVPVEGDFVIKSFTFPDGEALPELRIDYRTLGKPVKDSHWHGAQRCVDWTWHGR